MKTYFFEATPEDRELINNIAPSLNIAVADCVYIEEKLTAQNVTQYADAESISVFIHSDLSQAVIDQLPNLKFVGTRSTGFNHIDTKHAVSKNIIVTNVPSYGSRTVAEFAFALMLGLTRKTFESYHKVKNDHNFSLDGLEGFNLQGKTLGIIGTGRIGLNVAQIAKGFDMNMLAFDAYPNEVKAAELGFKYTTLDELLSQSDIVTLHTPYNPQTHHLLNKSNITKFKKGAVFINTARGEVIENEALLEALNQGIISAAGLDVVENEQNILETPSAKALVEHPNVAYTPHLAFFTKEAKREIIQTSMENIANFLKGDNKNKVQ